MLEALNPLTVTLGVRPGREVGLATSIPTTRSAAVVPCSAAQASAPRSGHRSPEPVAIAMSA